MEVKKTKTEHGTLIEIIAGDGKVLKNKTIGKVFDAYICIPESDDENNYIEIDTPEE